MKLGWPLISIISRFTADGIGILQSIIIVKILTVPEYGLVGIVTSIAAMVGVFQNLGISSGSTREIAVTKTRQEAFKVFLGSLTVRYAVTLPLIIGLFFASGYLGNTYYERPEIVLPIRIISFVLFVQALQSVFNSVIQGLKQFKFLFIFQAAIALVSLTVYIYFVSNYSVNGYFYALFAFNLISTLVLGYYVYKLFKGNFVFPTKKELWKIIKAVFVIGIYVYVIKIILTQWQRLGPVILAKELSDELIGLLTFALLVSTKITTISHAITDVTLPSMTSVFEKEKENFKQVFLKGNSRAFILILFISILLIFLKEYLFYFVDVLFGFIGKDAIVDKYSASFIIMDPLILAFWAYSIMNLFQSGLSVPTKKMNGALVSFLLLFVVTLFTYNKFSSDPLMSYSISMLLGAFVALIVYILFIKNEIKFWPITLKDLYALMFSIIALLAYYVGISLVILLPTYSLIIYLLLTNETNFKINKRK